MELGGEGGGHSAECPTAVFTPTRQSPASEGEEEELLMEEEEEEVLAGASAEEKSRRPPAKGTSEPAHPGERPGGGEEAGQAEGRTRVLEEAGDRSGLSCPQGPQDVWLTS